MATTKELMQARFGEVKAEVEQIRARTAPQREQLKALTEQQAALQPEIDRLAKEVHVHDEELFAKKQELSMLARALGGRTMSGV